MGSALSKYLNLARQVTKYYVRNAHRLHECVSLANIYSTNYSTIYSIIFIIFCYICKKLLYFCAYLHQIIAFASSYWLMKLLWHARFTESLPCLIEANKQLVLVKYYHRTNYSIELQ